jgi:hypothetical protein
VIEIKNLSDHLSPKARIEMIYKLPMVKLRSPYVIQQVIPEQRIIYDTSPDHSLEGQSEVELIETQSGTQIRWYGFYEPKSFSSLVSLGMFRFYFDRVFFRRLETVTRRARRLKKSKHTISVDTAA